MGTRERSIRVATAPKIYGEVEVSQNGMILEITARLMLLFKDQVKDKIKADASSKDIRKYKTRRS